MNEIEKAIETIKHISDIDTKYHLGISNYDLLTAIEALREKAEQENPKPLTLDELREMDGEPVWIVENGETKCGVVNLEGNCFEKEPVITLANGNFYLLKEYNGKTWPAYRTRPEGSGE